jgi:micrococcal nuclease
MNQPVTFNNCCWKNTKPYIPNLHKCKVIKVYDADSITVCSNLFLSEEKIYRFNLRLNGIDTPELRTKNEKEKEAAIKARDYLSNLILGKFIIVDVIKYDKYGRLLSDIFLDKILLNKLLVDKGYAKQYDGGTKSKWEF